jgi:hypothetical protein
MKFYLISKRETVKHSVIIWLPDKKNKKGEKCENIKIKAKVVSVFN